MGIVATRALALLPALFLMACAPTLGAQTPAESGDRPRAREAGVVIGTMAPGPNNAITDVPGVRVGHTTIVEPGQWQTGVTAILPHDGNVYRSRVPAAIYTANGYGKL